MKHLEKVINHYLTMKTNYATMITGDWGIGKTFFYNTILKKQIKNTVTISDNSKNYKPIHISLFGLKNIEEIQTEIFLCLYPILKNSKLKLSASIGKNLIKGFLHLKGVGEYSKYVEDINLAPKNVINFNELVLCFDDFERISNDLNLEEVVGYINSLVELENTKILIIANENKIKNKKYSILKEKIVGNTIEFIPDIKESIQNIIQIRYISDTVYRKFVLKNIELINEIAESNKNLRTLTFALDYFQYIFSQIEINIVSNKILLEKKEEILLYLLRFTLAISFEYKDGNITYKKRKDLDNNNFRLLFWQLDKNEEKQEEFDKTFRARFEKKYFNNINYIFHNSIYTYITGANIFEYTVLFEELKNIYHIIDNEIPVHYIAYNQLTGVKVYELSDKEYIETLKKLLKFSDNGLYLINEYLTILYLSLRYNNPLNLSLNHLIKRLKKGIDKSMNGQKYIPNLEVYLIINEANENKNHLIELREYIIKKNNFILNEILNTEYKYLENLFCNNIEVFINEIINAQKYLYSPFFNFFNPKKIFNCYSKGTNQNKFKLIEFLKYYCHNMYGYEKKSEIDFFKEINQIIEQKISKDKKKGLTYYLNNEFYIITKEISKKLS